MTRRARRSFSIGLGCLLLAGAMIAVPGQPAGAAAGTGTITGTVTDQVTGDPIAKLEVHASAGQGTYGVSTHSDGSYTIGGLPAGQYQVCGYPLFGPVPDPRPDGTGWLAGCHAGTVTVVAGQTTSGVDFALPPGGAFSGAVTDRVSGEPVAHVKVYVYAGTTIFAKFQTRANGTYRAIDLPTGTYYACFNAENADHSDFDLCYRNVVWDGFGRPASAAPIDVVAGHTTEHIFAVLPSAGTIAGTVTRTSDGTAVQWVRVNAFDATGRRAGYATTGPLGGYRITRLQPGQDYTVCFDTTAKWPQIRDQGNPTGLVPACWPGVPWDLRSIPPGAQPVHTTAGAVSTADADLVPGGALVASARSSETSDLLHAPIYVYDESGRQLRQALGHQPNHTRVNSLDPSATYRVCVDGRYAVDQGSGESGFASECFRSAPWAPGTAPSPGATQIAVTSGAITRATVRMDPAGEVGGTVLADDGTAIQVTISVFDGSGVLRSTGFANTFTAGDYEVLGAPAAPDDIVCFAADGYQPECYQDRSWDGDPADLPSGTTAVPVTAGSETAGINARLTPLS